MLAIVGTVPEEDFPLVEGQVGLEEDRVMIGGNRIPVNRGPVALLAAAIKTSEILGQPLPYVYLVGDTGLGRGSRRIYEHLAGSLGSTDFRAITFHYLLPDVDWHNKVLFAVEEMKRRPILIADAGFMYAAKMSGQAESYDLFTPDVGELAFLADEEAPHPFYTRGFILHENNRVPDLIARAYKHRNASRYLLVKGVRDYVTSREGIEAETDQPVEEALEAMGGTGDTLTGIVSALIVAGIYIPEAATLAARINRLAGYYAKPTPATQVMELIRHIPKAMEEILKERDRRDA
ncbi:MAG: sugar kinase [Deltaproteobacteria bacterium HGW-Deltaproteobacteria-21]|nr:MAG: sugar kinase [Deltaproteobacteria bacterium HGW-Deltaproteobacteria-21]